MVYYCIKYYSRTKNHTKVKHQIVVLTVPVFKTIFEDYCYGKTPSPRVHRGPHSLVSLKGTFSRITLLLFSSCLLSSVWYFLSCC